MRSAKLRRVHQNQRLSRLAKRRSSASENFRRRCAKYYAWVRTAIRRIKEYGLKLYICSITLAFESQTTSDRKPHRSDSGWRAEVDAAPSRLASQLLAACRRCGRSKSTKTPASSSRITTVTRSPMSTSRTSRGDVPAANLQDEARPMAANFAKLRQLTPA